MRFLVCLTLISAAACATSSPPSLEPLSIEFGQDVYLTDSYLQSTPGCQCGPPPYAPGGTEVRGPLPDGSWFRVFALESGGGEFDTVVLERGWEGREAHLVMRLYGGEGIVRLNDRGRKDAWGVNHPWADWLRAIGSRALSLQCASTV